MSLAAPPVSADLAASTPSRAQRSRQSLVDALGAVPGLVAGHNAPDVATAGSAWPRWVQTTYAGRLCSVAQDEFDVYAILPADYIATTVDQGDQFRDLIEPALTPVAVIAYSEPVAVQFNDNQTMPGLRFRVTSRT